MNLFDLTGKVAVVTGCNTGLGQGMALGLAKAGAIIVGVNREDPSETAQMIAELGGTFENIPANLFEVDAMQGLIDEVVAKYGKIDILVNNAGIIRREDAIDFSKENWDDVIGLNLTSVFHMSQIAARQFIKQGNGGKIINICSMLSYQGGIRVPSYTAAKSGLIGLTRALANEWAKYNINVNGIAPGYMATNNTAQLRADEQRSKEILDRIPAARWGLPSDLAGPVVFLASPASDYVNGFCLAVDGGWLSR